MLVAHGGFNNDFMMIQSNLERNDMDVGMLSKHNVHFSDTYVLAQKVTYVFILVFFKNSKISLLAATTHIRVKLIKLKYA